MRIAKKINLERISSALLSILFILILSSAGFLLYLPNLAEANASTRLFADNYHTNAGWHQVGSSITVNSSSFPGVVKFNNVIGGVSVTENRVVKHLPTTLPAGNWTAIFSYRYGSSSIPGGFEIFALTPSNIDPQDQSKYVIVADGDPAGDNQLSAEAGGVSTAGIPISAHTQYFITLEKTPTLLTLKIFSDSARTHQISGSPATVDITGIDLSKLNYLQHNGCKYCGDSRTLTATLDNTIITTP